MNRVSKDALALRVFDGVISVSDSYPHYKSSSGEAGRR